MLTMLAPIFVVISFFWFATFFRHKYPHVFQVNKESAVTTLSRNISTTRHNNHNIRLSFFQGTSTGFAVIMPEGFLRLAILRIGKFQIIRRLYTDSAIMCSREFF